MIFRQHLEFSNFMLQLLLLMASVPVFTFESTQADMLLKYPGKNGLLQSCPVELGHGSFQEDLFMQRGTPKNKNIACKI